MRGRSQLPPACKGSLPCLRPATSNRQMGALLLLLLHTFASLQIASMLLTQCKIHTCRFHSMTRYCLWPKLPTPKSTGIGGQMNWSSSVSNEKCRPRSQGVQMDLVRVLCRLKSTKRRLSSRKSIIVLLLAITCSQDLISLNFTFPGVEF